MFKYENYKVQERTFERFYKNTDRFTTKNGFMVAAGLVSGGFESILQIPREVGSFKFYRKTWETNLGLNFYELKTRPCSEDDFNWGDDSTSNKDSLFYKAGKSLPELQKRWQQLECIIDPNELYSSGNYDEA